MSPSLQAQKANQRAPSKDPATYDPIVAFDKSKEEWIRIAPTVPTEDLQERMYQHILTRRKGESDEALAFRFYAEVGAVESLDQALKVYGVLKERGHESSHRWLYVAEARSYMRFIDLRTATRDGNPAVWVQTRLLGHLESSERWEMDCQGRRHRILAYTAFKPDGTADHMWSDPTPWELTGPGSVGEAILDFSCN